MCVCVCVIYFHRAIPTLSQSAVHKEGNSLIESMIDITYIKIRYVN